jgi:hypothetical protein
MRRSRQISAFTRQHRRPLLIAAGLCVAIVAGFVIAPRLVAAQMQYDFNGDGKVTCADFQEQYPTTYTDEATNALQQYPQALAQLNGNPKENAVACEGQPASADPPKKSTATPTPTPTPARTTATATATPQPTATPATTAPASSPAGTTEVPADIMARVQGCAVVAISGHDVVGAGCPGVGAVAFTIPDTAPPMGDTVIMEPSSPLAASAPAAPRATSAGGSSQAGKKTSNTSNTSTSTKKSGKNATNSGRSGKSSKSGSSNTATTTNNGSSTSDNGKHNGKHHGKHKGKHHGKNKKHGQKHKKSNNGKNGKTQGTS